MPSDEGGKNLEAYILEHAEVHRDMDKRMREVEGGLREKIGYKFFYTVIAAIVTANIGLGAFILKYAIATNTTVASIQGKLEPFDFITEE